MWVPLCACNAPDESPADTAGVHQQVVYGEDDRQEVYAHPDTALRQLTRQSIVVLMNQDVVDARDPSNTTTTTNTDATRASESGP